MILFYFDFIFRQASSPPLAATKLTYRRRLLYYLKAASTAVLEIPRPRLICTRMDPNELPMTINTSSVPPRDGDGTVSVLGASMLTDSVDEDDLQQVVLKPPPHPPLIPNKDVPLNKQKIRAAHKEPAWKSGRAKEQEAWQREKKREDDAIDEAHNQNRLYNDLRVRSKEYVDEAKKFHKASEKKILDALQ